MYARIATFEGDPAKVDDAINMVRSEVESGETPPELAPRLVHALASGKLDALSGRYLHSEHDDVDDLAVRVGEIVENDLNAIRLRR